MPSEREEIVKVEGGVESCQQEGGGREVCQLLLKFSPWCMKPPLLNVIQPRPAIPNVLFLEVAKSQTRVSDFRLAFYLFTYGFMAVLGLGCCTWTLSSCRER